MKRVICVVEDEKILIILLPNIYAKKVMKLDRTIHMKKPALMFKMMMFIYGSWISCWMTNQVLI